VKRATEVCAGQSAAHFAGWDHQNAATQGSAALHPGLYAAARYRRLIEGFRSDRPQLRCRYNLARRKKDVDGLFHKRRTRLGY